MDNDNKKLSYSPIISVIIPTFNRKELVALAIECVLNQTLTRDQYEIIVIDDGSTDGTDIFLDEKFGDQVRYFWQKNQGESAARNLGVSLAKGEYLAFLDSDDIWYPEKLEAQLKTINIKKNCSLVYSSAHLIDESGNFIVNRPVGRKITDNEISFDGLLFTSVIYGIASNIFMPKNFFTEVGGFDESIRYGEDWEFLFRIIEKGNFEYIDKPLWACRVHSNNQNSIHSVRIIEDVLNDHLKIIDKIFKGRNDYSQQSLKDRIMAVQYERAAYSYTELGEWNLSRCYFKIASHYDTATQSKARVQIFSSNACSKLLINHIGSLAQKKKIMNTYIEEWRSNTQYPIINIHDFYSCCYGKLSNYYFRIGEYRTFRICFLLGLFYNAKRIISKQAIINFLYSIFPIKFFNTIKND